MRKKTGIRYCKTRLQLRKCVVMAAKEIPTYFYHNVYNRLMKVMYLAYQKEDLI